MIQAAGCVQPRLRKIELPSSPARGVLKTPRPEAAPIRTATRIRSRRGSRFPDPSGFLETPVIVLQSDRSPAFFLSHANPRGPLSTFLCPASRGTEHDRSKAVFSGSGSGDTASLQFWFSVTDAPESQVTSTTSP